MPAIDSTGPITYMTNFEWPKSAVWFTRYDGTHLLHQQPRILGVLFSKMRECSPFLLTPILPLIKVRRRYTTINHSMRGYRLSEADGVAIDGHRRWWFIDVSRLVAWVWRQFFDARRANKWRRLLRIVKQRLLRRIDVAIADRQQHGVEERDKGQLDGSIDGSTFEFFFFVSDNNLS